MHAISAPRREFGWTRIRAAPNEPTMGDYKRSAELLPVPTRLAISPPAEAASGPNSERAANIAFAQRVSDVASATSLTTPSGAGLMRGPDPPGVAKAEDRRERFGRNPHTK